VVTPFHPENAIIQLHKDGRESQMPICQRHVVTDKILHQSFFDKFHIHLADTDINMDSVLDSRWLANFCIFDRDFNKMTLFNNQIVIKVVN
jgi:hypothetical protein